MTHDHHHEPSGRCCGAGAAPKAAASAAAKDPVCGMTVDPAKTAHHAEHAGATYHFCCAGCRTRFEADPDKYLAPKAEDPVCGMTVDPAKTAHHADHAGATYHFCCNGCRTKFAADPGRYLAPKAAAPAAAKDPVCGMTVDPAKTAHHADHAGTAYHFCSAGCRTKFAADPDKYLHPAPREEAPAPPGTVYTCPMDPEVRQVGPGTCPICGMALEPAEFDPDAGPNPELVDMRRRAWIAAAGAVPVVVLAMGEDLLGDRFPVRGQLSNGLQFLFASFAVFYAGWPVFERGWASLRSRNLNMFTLIALGTGVAYGYSAAATLLPGLFPPAFRGAGGAVGVYFEAAAVITVLVLLGQVLELRARDSTASAIRGLLDLAPKAARRIGADGTEADVPLAELRAGDRLRVRPGEAVPADGTVEEGEAALDASSVTGESMPVAARPGDAVIGGTLCRSGALVIRADRVGRDTLLSRVVQLVAEAQRSRAPIQRAADRAAGVFVPAVTLAAAAAFAAWMLFGPEPRFAHALIAAVSVLIIACPCALGLATPMSIMVGVGRGAQLGVLVRDAEALERLERVDTVVLDKTGTLTTGRPAVTAVAPAAGFAADEVLALAAAAERASEHPLGAAIVEAAAARGLTLAEAAGFEAPAGRGVSAVVGGRAVLVGSERFLAEGGVDAAALAREAAAFRAGGATAVLVAADGGLAGAIGIADAVRPDADAVVAALKREGLRVVMLTGDNAATARAVAGPLGIDEVEAEVLPDGKAAAIGRLRREGRRVAMAGDGVNDAPALALADVGIAMGTGADVAVKSAGVTLLGGDLAGLLRARRLSRATLRNVRQNLAFAFLYNGVGVPVAAGALYPLFGVTLSPMLAAAAMALSSVSVIGNALRLRAADLSDPPPRTRP